MKKLIMTLMALGLAGTASAGVGAGSASGAASAGCARSAGAASTIADSAGGYAGYTLFPAASSVLTVEFKINLIAPAHGEKLIATGRVKKPGRTLTVCELEVAVLRGGRSKTCALGLQTLMCVRGRADMPQSG